MEVESMKFLAAAIALLPIFGVGMALGRMFGSFFEAIARNPDAEAKIGGRLIFGFAVTEALGIFCLGVSIMILLGIFG